MMKLDPVGIVGDVGATLNVQTTFEIANVEYMANFTKVRQNYFLISISKLPR